MFITAGPRTKLFAGGHIGPFANSTYFAGKIYESRRLVGGFCVRDAMAAVDNSQVRKRTNTLAPRARSTMVSLASVPEFALVSNAHGQRLTLNLHIPSESGESIYRVRVGVREGGRRGGPRGVRERDRESA